MVTRRLERILADGARLIRSWDEAPPLDMTHLPPRGHAGKVVREGVRARRLQSPALRKAVKHLWAHKGR